MSLLKLAWKNLFNKPWSLALGILLFALGIGMISLLMLIQHQLQGKFDKNLAGIDLVIGAKGSPLQLILSSMYHIDNPTGNISLDDAAPFLNPKHPLIKNTVPLSLGDSHKTYRIIGTLHRFVELYEGELREGKLWEEDMEVTIGAMVADRLGLNIGDGFYGSHGLIEDENLVHDDAPTFEVVGILKPTGSVLDQVILTNTASVWKVHGEDTEGLPDIGVEIPDSIRARYEESPKEITSLLVQFGKRNFQTLNMQRNINQNTDLQAATPAIEINRLYSLMGAGLGLLRSIALAIILVSAISIFISLYSSLKDRRYEIALMRVGGASRSKIFSLVVLEGLIMAFLGCLVGLILSHLSMGFLAGFLEDSYRYTFTGKEFLTNEWFLIIGSLILGFVAAVIPAIQAYRTPITETLTNR